jgi:N-acetylglucosamine-6-phosphate deacetylase
MSIKDINTLLERFSKVNHTAFRGVHLEGPYLNASKLGAHKREFVIEPSVSSYKKIVGQYMDIVKRVTVACELDKDYSLAKYLIENGIIVSFGHTSCNAEDSYKAFKNGYTLSTHHFNAMPLMHHRDVSITGTSLINDNVRCEYIPDFYHVSKEMLNILFKCKPENNLIMVTDSISATCLADGKYSLGGLAVNVKDGLVTDKSGTIAGSSITMAEGVYRMLNNNFDKITVLKSATSNPANLMNLSNKGYLNKGYDADINILDENFKHIYTIYQGKAMKFMKNT